MGSSTFRVLLIDFCCGLDTGCRPSMNMTPPPEGASVPAVPTTLSQSQSLSVDDKFAARGETAGQHFLAAGKAPPADHVFADIRDAIDAGRLVTRGLVAQGSGGPAA